jgi:hypothetical protein
VVVHVFSVRLLALLLNPQDETAKSDNLNQIFVSVAKRRLNIPETFPSSLRNAALSAFEEGTYNKKWPTLVTKIGQLR